MSSYVPIPEAPLADTHPHTWLGTLTGHIRLLAPPSALRLQLPSKHGGALHRRRCERAEPHRGREDVHGQHPRDVHRHCAGLADRADVVPGTLRATQPEREHDRLRGPRVKALSREVGFRSVL